MAEATKAEEYNDKPDRYGQVHPKESPELIKNGLEKLEAEIDKMSDNEKIGWVQAKEKCSPELVDNKHKLMFLRSEVFRPDDAARRLVNYWKMRIDLFGEDKAFLPLTLSSGAMEGTEKAFASSFVRLTGTTDDTGRQIVFADPSRHDKSKGYSTKDMVRCNWYILHAVLEDEEVTQKKGMVFMAFPRNAKFSQFDRQHDVLMIKSIRGCLPIRVSAIHICHPPSFFRIIFNIIKYFLGSRLRARVKVHSGSDEIVLKKLESFGIQRTNVPSDMGGGVVLDNDKWLKERKEAGL